MKAQMKKLIVASFALIIGLAMTSAGRSKPVPERTDFTGFGFVLTFGPETERQDLLISRHNRADGTFSGDLRRTDDRGRSQPNINVTGTITPLPSTGIVSGRSAYKITFTTVAGTSTRITPVPSSGGLSSTYEGAFTILHKGPPAGGEDYGFIAGTYTSTRTELGRRVTSGPFPFSGNGTTIPR